MFLIQPRFLLTEFPFNSMCSSDLHMKFLLLNVAFLAVFVSAEELRLSHGNAPDPTYDCMINNLQSKALLDDGFPKIKNNTMCTVILDSAVAVALRNINETFVDDDKINVKCLLDSLVKNHFEDEIFKKIVYEEAKHLTAAEKEEKSKISEKNFTAFIVNQTADCIEGRKFLQMIFENKSVDLSDNGNYCARKFTIYKNLLNPSDYKINVNLDKFDPRVIDCNAEISKIQNEFNEIFIKDFSDSQKKCFQEKIKIEETFENLIWIKVLQDIDAFDNLKEKEQKKFDEFLPKLFRSYALCQLE